MLALLVHELTQLSKRKHIYVLRVLPVVVLWIWLVDAGGHGTVAPARAASLSARAFGWLSFLEAATLLGAVLFWTAPAIAAERERGTLSLLLCSALSPLEIAIAKILSRLALGATQVLALISAFAIVLVIGGVDPQQLVRFHLALGAAACFTAALVLCASARRRSTLRALLFAAGVLLLLWFCVPVCLAALEESGLLPHGTVLHLRPLHTPALLMAAADPALYEQWFASVGQWAFGAGLTAHVVAAGMLLWLATCHIGATKLLWANGRHACPKRRRSRGRLQREAGRGRSMACWMLERLERWRPLNPMLRRAWMANPYDADSFGRAVVVGSAILVVALLVGRAVGDSLTLVAGGLAAAGLLLGIFLPVTGAVLTGGALSLTLLAEEEAEWRLLLCILGIATVGGMLVCTAIGVARDASSGLLQQLLVSPLRSCELAAGHLYCAARAALPLVAFWGGFYLMLVVGPLVDDRFRTRVPGVQVWFWPAELIADTLAALGLGAAYGLVTAAPQRVVGYTLATAVFWAGTLLFGVASDDPLFVPCAASIVIALCVTGTMCSRERSTLGWLALSAGYWAWTLLVSLVSAAGAETFLHTGTTWGGYWPAFPANVLVLSTRGDPPLGFALLTLASNFGVAVGVVAVYFGGYDLCVQRPRGAGPARAKRSPRPGQ